MKFDGTTSSSVGKLGITKEPISSEFYIKENPFLKFWMPSLLKIPKNTNLNIKTSPNFCGSHQFENVKYYKKRKEIQCYNWPLVLIFNFFGITHWCFNQSFSVCHS